MSQKAKNTDSALESAPESAQMTSEELTALNSAQNEVIAELQAKITQLEKEKAAAAGAVVVVTLDDVQYRVVHGLRIRGSLKSAADIAADPALCQALLESKSSAIKPL